MGDKKLTPADVMKSFMKQNPQATEAEVKEFVYQAVLRSPENLGRQIFDEAFDQFLSERTDDDGSLISEQFIEWVKEENAIDDRLRAIGKRPGTGRPKR